MFLTSARPAFALAALSRDIADATVNVKRYADYNGVRRQMLKNIAPAALVLAADPWNTDYSEIEGGNINKKTLKRLKDSWALAQRYGVPMSWSNYDGHKESMKKLLDEIKAIERGGSIVRYVEKNAMMYFL